MPDAQCSLLPNVLKHSFYSRRFSNRSFYNRRFCNRSFSGQERLDLEFLVYRPSSIVQVFVPLRFAIFFYSKIFGIESSPRWGEGRVRGPSLPPFSSPFLKYCYAFGEWRQVVDFSLLIFILNGWFLF